MGVAVRAGAACATTTAANVFLAEFSVGVEPVTVITRFTIVSFMFSTICARLWRTFATFANFQLAYLVSTIQIITFIARKANFRTVTETTLNLSYCHLPIVTSTNDRLASGINVEVKIIIARATDLCIMSGTTFS